MVGVAKPVDDVDGVKGAFEKIRDTFANAEDVEEIRRQTGRGFRHEKKRLRAMFIDETKYAGSYRRYRMEFERDGDGSFQADVRPDTPVHSRILLMDGCRYHAHSGQFSGVRDSIRNFREYCSNGDWVKVDGEQMVIITPIDDVRPSELVDNYDRFLSLVLDFKGGNGSSKFTKPNRYAPTIPFARSLVGESLNTILYGPPGTGKTYVTAQRCVEICDGGRSDNNRKRYKQLVDSGQIEFVTFHQSYGYEEFVEGLRPAPNKDGQAGFRLEPTPGVLKRIADRARGDRENAYVLVIDEINRANVSKVLGELITLLEEDKREGAPNEVAVTLPHSGKRFTLPSNLHILGTMNTADRSTALIDTALRRRFRFEEMAPKPELLGDVKGVELSTVLKAINERLEYLIDRDHLIGHAWLMRVETKAQVDDVMRHKIIPLIAEYFHDDWRKVQAVLGGTDHFVLREPLQRPPSLDDADVDERSRWTVRDQFPSKAYSQLVVGQQTPREASEADDGVSGAP